MAKDSTRDGLYNCDRYRGGKHGEGQYKGWRTVVTATRGRYLGVTHEESWAVGRSCTQLYAQSVALQQVWQSVSCACGERYVIHVLNAGMGGGVGDVLRVACS